MRRAWVLLRCVGILAFLAAGGCSRIDELRGAEEAPTREVWAGEAEALCAASRTAMQAQGLQQLEADAPNGNVAAHRAALRARRRGYVEVQELVPPAGLEGEVRAFTQAAIDAIDDLTARSRAREAGDGTTEATSLARAVERLASARTAATRLGLSACVP